MVSASEMLSTTTLILSALSVLAGCVSAAPASFNVSSGDHEASERHDIAWEDCSIFGVNSTDPNLKCGYHKVPMDYHDHTAGRARLAVIKYSATAAEKKGVLFTNPGGPGAPGTALIPLIGQLISEQLEGTYDIVSWDPRGVGNYTTPGAVTCFNTPEEQDAFFRNTVLRSINETIAGKFDDKDSKELYSRVEDTEQKILELGERCKQGPAGKYLQYIGTSSTVRDLLSLSDRLAGKDKPVDFWGFSYGTVIGYNLINTFPSRVGHVILDAVVDPMVWVSYKIVPACMVDTEKTYSGLTDGCAAAGMERCRLVELVGDGANGDKIKRLINDGIDVALKLYRAGVNPLPLEPGLLRAKIGETLHNPQEWSAFTNRALYPLVARLFQAAQAHNIPLSDDKDIVYHVPSGTVDFDASLMQSWPPPGTLRSFAFDAIVGADNNNDDTVTMKDVFDVIINTTKTVSPSFGAIWDNGYNYKWPVRSVEALIPARPVQLDKPVLVIGNSGDPVTPLAGARSAANLLGDRATLVEQQSFGHSSLADPSPCTLGIIKTYLLNSTLPQGHDIKCEGTIELFPAQNSTNQKRTVFVPSVYRW